MYSTGVICRGRVLGSDAILTGTAVSMTEDGVADGVSASRANSPFAQPELVELDIPIYIHHPSLFLPLASCSPAAVVTQWKVSVMSASLLRSRRRVRFAAILVSLSTVLVAACAVDDISGPESSQPPSGYTSLARGEFSLNCTGGVAVQFDGYNDRIRLDAEALGSPPSVTVEAWVKIDESNKVHVLITDALDDFNDGFTLLVTAENRARFSVAANVSTHAGVTGATPLETGRWYHVAGRYDDEASKLSVLVDGVVDGSTDYSDGIAYATSRGLRFGMQYKGFNQNGRFLKGAIDDVRIWDHARTVEEISSAMGMDIEGASKGLIGYWPMEEGEGTTTADMTDSGNTGHFEEGPVWVAMDTSDCTGELTIDVKPGDDPDLPKPITLNSGKIPVAILGTPEFDVARQLDLASITFGRTGDEPSMHWRGVGEPNCSVDDVNDDGRDDLVCHFLTTRTGLRPGDAEVILKGKSSDDSAVMSRMAELDIAASDAVTVKSSGGTGNRGG